ncbi:unnamed protein product, partial [Protopolystoma xenopodis]
MGSPTEATWPGVSKLPQYNSLLGPSPGSADSGTGSAGGFSGTGLLGNGGPLGCGSSARLPSLASSSASTPGTSSGGGLGGGGASRGASEEADADGGCVFSTASLD